MKKNYEPKSVLRHLFQERGHGFTLIELLVVIAVILILAVMMIKGGQYLKGKGDVYRTQATAQILDAAIQSYYLKNGTYPPPTAVGLHRFGSRIRNIYYTVKYTDIKDYLKGAGVQVSTSKDNPSSLAFVKRTVVEGGPNDFGWYCGGSAGDLMICDAYGRPYFYFVAGNSGAFNAGFYNWNIKFTHNPGSYDLFSLGADAETPGAYNSHEATGWTSTIGLVCNWSQSGCYPPCTGWVSSGYPASLTNTAADDIWP